MMCKSICILTHQQCTIFSVNAGTGSRLLSIQQILLFHMHA